MRVDEDLRLILLRRRAFKRATGVRLTASSP